MEVIRITLTVEVPEGLDVQLQTPRDNQATGPPAAVTAGRALEHARTLLEDLGYKDPARALEQFTPERIVEVCLAARSRLTELQNPAAYVNTVLRRGWKVRPSGNGGTDHGEGQAEEGQG